MGTKKRPGRIRIRMAEMRQLLREYPTSHRIIYAAYWKPKGTELAEREV